MKIGFEAISIFGASGIEMYSRSLIEALAKSELDIELKLFTSSGRLQKVNKYFGDYGKIIPRRIYQHPLILGKTGAPFVKYIKNNYLMKKAAAEVDLYHNVNPCYYNKRIKNTAVTVHDIFVFSDEEWALEAFDKEQLEYRENFLAAFELAKVILTISKNVKDELLQKFPFIDENKVFVTYAGVSEIFQQKEADYEKLIKYNLFPGTKYFLFVSRFDPRKNYKSIVKAFSMLPDSVKKAYKLVFVGGEKAKRINELYNYVSSLGIEDNFIHLDNIPVEDLTEVYNAATALVFPTYAEGFGLPVIEAMKCGCPVLTSNTSCLPEIAGNAALLVNPRDITEIRDGMLALAEDKDLRHRLIAEGLERVKLFTWEKCAEDTYKAYEYGISKL